VCAVVPDSLDFGNVVIGGSSDTTFTITNTGGSLLSGDVSEPCAHYSIVSGGGPYALAAGEFVNVTVRFEPTSTGTHTCLVETGQAICSDVFCTGVGEDAPLCVIEPNAIDFGTVLVWDYRDTTFTITNAGTQPLIGNVTKPWCPDFEFLSGDGNFNLAPAESLVVTVRCAPVDTGLINCSIDTGTLLCSNVSLTVYGVDPLLSPEPPQQTGWPHQVALETASSPVIGDIDGDTYPDVVVGSNYIYAWHGDGTEIRDGDNDPLTSGVLNTQGDNFVATVALADIDGNPGAEIIAASWNTNEIYIFDHNGNTLPGWPQSTGTYCWASPVVGDIDCDGDMEIIANPKDNKLFAWHHDGTEVRDGDSNPGTNGVFRVFATNYATQNSTPALVDIDDDGVVEIVVCANNDSIYCMNGDGSPVPGWPVPVYQVGSTISASPAAGDIDGDGQQEIIVQNSHGGIYGINHDGTVMSGWPRWVNFNWHFVGSPALADLTGDGKLEIVLPSMNGNCYVYRYNGSSLPNWPQPYAPGGHTESSPIIVDIDQDGSLDIILPTENGYLNAWDVNGDYVPGFPIKPGPWLRGTPMVGDLDLDADLELIATGWVDQSVYVWDLAANTYDGYDVWNGFHENNFNTGWIQFSGEDALAYAVQPDNLDFGTVPVGGNADTTFTITNTGASVLSGDVSESCDHYSIVSGGGPYSLAGGEFVSVTVRFEPTVSGTHTCSIGIGSGPAHCIEVTCTGDGDNPTVCNLDPDSLDFGAVLLGNQVDTSFTLTNIWGDTLSGVVSEACGDYSIVSGGGPYSLAPSESLLVAVRFAPTSVGTLTCAIETGSVGCGDVYCIGIGDVPSVCLVEPDTLHFGAIAMTDSLDKTFIITNTGGSILSGSVSETCGDYDVVAGQGPYNLAAGETLQVAVRFNPPGEGQYECTLETGTADCADVYCDGAGSSVIGVPDDVPRTVALYQNYPNPFNPTTTIAFSLPEKVTVKLSIYDVDGRLVTTLVDGVLDRGRKEYVWEGTNSGGNQVSSGIYFYRLRAGTTLLTKKMVLLK
jgi:hypothetical protein